MSSSGRNLPTTATGQERTVRYAPQLTRAFIIQRIAFVWRWQHDDLLGNIRGHERPHGGEAAVVIDAPTAGLAV